MCVCLNHVTCMGIVHVCVCVCVFLTQLTLRAQYDGLLTTQQGGHTCEVLASASFGLASRGIGKRFIWVSVARYWQALHLG